MSNQKDRETLAQLLANVRRRIFLRTASASLVRAILVGLPPAALLIAADQRWNQGNASLWIALAALAAPIAFAAAVGFKGLGVRLRSALALDEEAQLKDRISSAFEFLEVGVLDEARQTQIRDAIRCGEALDRASIFQFRWPKFAGLLPVVTLVFLLSFFIPPLSSPRATAAIDETKLAQLDQLKQLAQELQAREDVPKELEEVLKKLDDVRKQFEKGEISERDVMLQLARLDENLRQKASQLGAENLEGEMNILVPHLMSSAATLEAANALKENKLDKAAQELDKLAEKVSKEALTKEEKRELAMNMGVCAAKLGKKDSGSFGGDLAKASESLEQSDCEGFKSACKSMGNKLGLLKQCRSLMSACKKIGNCKGGLGQCQSKEAGYTQGPKTQSDKKGGLKAGTGTSGDPFGDAQRLADSYRKMLQVSGQAGEGPVESQTEITEGQVSQSQLSAKEVHANFAAIAEEVIEKENIPLSHRYHVKRYFQSIRPADPSVAPEPK